MSDAAEAERRDNRDDNQSDVDPKRSIEPIKPDIRHRRLQGSRSITINCNRVEVDLLDRDERPQEHSQQDGQHHVHKNAVAVQEIERVRPEKGKDDAHHSLV